MNSSNQDCTLLFTIINLVLVIILEIPSTHSIKISVLLKEKKYVFIPNSTVNVHYRSIRAFVDVYAS